MRWRGELVHRLRPGGGAHLHRHPRRVDPLRRSARTSACAPSWTSDLARAQRTRFIAATCERGMAESIDEVRAFNARETRSRRPTPTSWRSPPARHSAATRRRRCRQADATAGVPSRGGRQPAQAAPAAASSGRRPAHRHAAGAQHVLLRPLLHRLPGEPGREAHSHIVWSDYTDDQMYREGSRRGSIDPCFPAKVAISHVHNLLHKKRVGHHLLPGDHERAHARSTNARRSWSLPHGAGDTGGGQGSLHHRERRLRRERASATTTPSSTWASPTSSSRQMYLLLPPASWA